MFTQEPRVTLKTDNKTAYYNLYWSPLQEADKYKIVTSVPSLSGVYELYYEDDEKKLNLLTVGVAWLGGLRSQIRSDIDPDGKTAEIQNIIENNKLYFRYTISQSFNAIKDVAWFLNQMYFKEDATIEHSKQFETIYVKEFAPDKLHWV